MEARMKRSRILLVSAIGTLAAIAFSSTIQAQAAARPEPGNKPIERFTARAVQMQTGMTGPVDMNVTRWSTDAERQKLLDLLQESGQPAMMAELQKLPQTGYIKMPNTMGAGLFYARDNMLPDGSRQVVLGTARSVGMAARAPQASQYDATIVELRFPKGAEKGEGKIVMAGKVSVGKDDKVQITNYQGEPVRLMDVRVVK
jgi:hypothetical protein